MSDYSEKLRDPRWQRRRLEIMGAANFKCQHCGADDQTLNVHHRIYRKGLAPWEYEDHELCCLCEWCHSDTHKINTQLAQEMLSVRCPRRVLGYVLAMNAVEYDVPLTLEDCPPGDLAIRIGMSDFLRTPLDFNNPSNINMDVSAYKPFNGEWVKPKD